MQLVYDIVFISVRKSTRTLGAVMEEEQIPRMAIFQSRKYIGVCRQDSQVTVTMMRRFPRRVVMYTKLKKKKKK